MASLTVFLQPMSEAMGWSCTGISTAALINWLCMGLGAFLWGGLSDRFGTRVVVLVGGALLGLGLVTRELATSPRDAAARRPRSPCHRRRGSR